MNFSKKAISLAGILLIVVQSLPAQVRQTREEYIDRYKSIAVAHMERYGIPASITMAQGILESDCGNSWLSLQSNNHFGIKCKRNWTGDKVYYDDDAKGECFRSYPSVEASYRDHAEFLDSQPRYDSLFAYSPTTTRLGAGLKAAGYATAPDYAAALPHHRGGRFPAGPARRRAALPSRSGRKITDPKVVHRPDQHGAPGRRIVGRRPDNYRVTINAHNGYNVYRPTACTTCWPRRATRSRTSGRNSAFRPQSAQVQRSEGQEGPADAQVVYIERKKNAGRATPTPTLPQGETAYAVGQSTPSAPVDRELNSLRPGDTLEKGQQIRIK
ncbi:MAG: glycoside hydrolase family 73 protein [Alistipes sp.]